MGKFPGQADKLVFSLEQIRTLTSSVRSEVFYSFSHHEPMSVADVARDLGKSAQTVHYHVNELVQAGLLIAVAERHRRSRIEKLYVQAALEVFSMNPAEASDEYRSLIIKGFNAITRAMARENAEGQKLIALDPQFNTLNAYRHSLVRVADFNKAKALKDKLYSVLQEISMNDDPNGKYTVRVSVNMSPNAATAREGRATEAKKARKTKAK